MQSVAFSVKVKHNWKNVGEVRGTMIGNVKESGKHICKLRGIKINVKWMVSFTIGVRASLNTLKHHQVQSDSLRVVNIFSMYKEFYDISLRQKKKSGIASIFALEAAMRHELLWRLIGTVLF